MKTIGLIGGMSWESTVTYYSIINSRINAELGKNHSAQCIVYSFDFQNIEELQYAGKWAELEVELIKAAKALKAAGADFLVICTNTVHKVADNIEKEVGLPLLHIADVVGEAVQTDGRQRIGLLGTIFTMEEDFYVRRLESKFGLDVLVPEKNDRQVINNIIFSELVKGIVKERSKNEYLRIMDILKNQEAEGIVLGCTEIGLLIKEYDLPLYDSAVLHANKAATMSLIP
ncbi:MAG TPA: amino acid racemase [Rectinema sp.]|jgi:aspartate racemase|nr:amino acid racemase [Spirochaetota bacterium]NLH90007.1 amino acid racemase [Treponema sp.]HNP93624.1 amino acid racemase [Rectinema sp.]HNT59848.1 amino acid racemase [Rectinema sp.]HNV36788.1 amino acid racemase [Rectinema sp.]